MPTLALDREEVFAQLQESGVAAELGIKSPSEVQIITIRIRKGFGKGEEMTLAEVCPDLLPKEEVERVWQLGLEGRINSTGFTKVEKGDAEAALEKAAENIQKLYEGKLRAPIGLAKKGKKAPKATDREELAEARRLSRTEVKELIRSGGGKVTHYSVKAINAMADNMLEDEEFGPPIWVEAKKIIAERTKARTAASARSAKRGKPIDLLKAHGLKEDPEMVAKAEAKAAKAANARKRKGGESRAQA